MKAIMIAAMNSNSGKTALSLALCRALKIRNMKTKYYKSGPDFLDSKLGLYASDYDYGNIDSYLQGDEGVLKSASLGEYDYAIVEGVMGYLDGIKNTYKYSSYYNSKLLGIDSILVLRPKGEMFSLAAKLRGFLAYCNNISGVIINETKEKLYLMYKDLIESELNIKCYGYIAKDDNFNISEDSLGLKLPKNIEYFKLKLDKMASIMEDTVDVNSVIKDMKSVKRIKTKEYSKCNTKIAIAFDEAFSFYYRENLLFLEKYFNIVYFSPLKDSCVPECDMIYFGGGYLSKYLSQLEKNRSMIDDIIKKSKEGCFIFAEGEGSYYLGEKFDDFSMCSLLDSHAKKTEHLVNFGYTKLKALKDNFLFDKDIEFKAQEFHKSQAESQEYNLFKNYKDVENKSRISGIFKDGIIAIEQNIVFLQNEEYFYNKFKALGGKNVQK